MTPDAVHSKRCLECRQKWQQDKRRRLEQQQSQAASSSSSPAAVPGEDEAARGLKRAGSDLDDTARTRDLESDRGLKRTGSDLDDTVRMRDLESDRGVKRTGSDLDDTVRVRDLEEETETTPMEDVRQNIWLDEIAACAQSGPPWFCEITGKPLDEKEVEKAMLKEIDMINSFGTLKEARLENDEDHWHKMLLGDHVETDGGQPEQ